MLSSEGINARPQMQMMISGAIVVLLLYLTGIFSLLPQQPIGAATAFRPYYLLGLEPLIWGLLVSGISGVVGSYLSPPMDEELVSRMFDEQKPMPGGESAGSATAPV